MKKKYHSGHHGERHCAVSTIKRRTIIMDSLSKKELFYGATYVSSRRNKKFLIIGMVLVLEIFAYFDFPILE